MIPEKITPPDKSFKQQQKEAEKVKLSVQKDLEKRQQEHNKKTSQ